MKKTITLILLIQTTFMYAQNNESSSDAGSLMLLENYDTNLKLSLVNNQVEISSPLMKMEKRQKQMKSAARWLIVGTIVQIGGSFLVMTNNESHKHSTFLGLEFPEWHQHSGMVPFIAAGSAINLIGIWKMYKAWS